jgi:hypothetical protein
MWFALVTLVLGINTLRRPTWFGVVLFIAAIGLIANIWCQSIGQPKPLWLVNMHQKFTMLAYRSDEPKQIYFWILPQGSSVPLSVVMPWSEKVAADAQAAMQASKGTGGTPVLRFNGGLKAGYGADFGVNLPRWQPKAAQNLQSEDTESEN